MDLEELRVLLAIAETGSVLAASDRLRLTRATVRRRVDALEARVGAPLLARGPSGAGLTEAGMVVAARARTLLEEAAALIASARDAGETASGVLRVVLPVGLPTQAVVGLFGALRVAHPRLRFHARFAEDPLLALSGDLDLAFHFGDRPVDGPWITRVVLPMQERILASPSYLAARGVPRTPDDLAGHELLGWVRPGADPLVWPTTTGGPIVVAPILLTSDLHTLRQLALAGHGLVFAPDPPFPDPGFDADALVAVLPGLVVRDCPLRMVVPEAMAGAPKVRRVLEGLAMFRDSEG